MIADWQTNCVYFSDRLPVRQPALWRQLKQRLTANAIKSYLVPGTRDIWVRDFMPVQVGNEDFVQFRYEPDYLGGNDELVTGLNVCRSVPHIRCLRASDVVLDGGNVVAASGKAILTEKVFQENRRYRRQELERELQSLLGVEECIFIPREPGDPIGHADGVVRFLEDDRVVVNDYSKVAPAYGGRLRETLRRHGFRVEEVPYFWAAKMVDGIPSAVGNYINYLRTERLVVVPAYGAWEDDAACRRLEGLLTETRIVPLRCDGLAQEGGVLNCVSWTIQIKEKELSPSYPFTGR